MAGIPKTMVLPEFDRLRVLAESKFEDELIEYLKALHEVLQRETRAVRTFVDTGGFSTAGWRMKEATAADVADGKANAAGDLMLQKKISGVWQSSQIFYGS